MGSNGVKFQQGIDIVSVERFEKVARLHGDRFLDRIFTPQERAYCESKRFKYEHYAARFAAKEAMMKAMEIRRRNRFRFREIEIRREATGKPTVFLSKESAARFGLPEGARVELSMAHERRYAVSAVVLILP